MAGLLVHFNEVFVLLLCRPHAIIDPHPYLSLSTMFEARNMFQILSRCESVARLTLQIEPGHINKENIGPLFHCQVDKLMAKLLQGKYLGSNKDICMKF